MLHDENYRTQIIDRIRHLRRDTPRRWGKMSADQMLWHVNSGLLMALGQIDVPPRKLPMPRPLVRFFVLNLPWPKGVPTMPMFVASGSVRLRIGTRAVPAADRSARSEGARRALADAPAARSAVRPRCQPAAGEASRSSLEAIWSLITGQCEMDAGRCE